MTDWARQDPRGAARACLALAPADRDRALRALLNAEAVDLAQVPVLARALAALDPDNGRAYGYLAIEALVDRSAAPAAAAYAANTDAPYRSDLVNAAYYRWGRTDSESAVLEALKLPAGLERTLAFDSALSGWAMANPQALADTALHFPEGPERTEALTKAIRSWVILDPTAAGNWIAVNPGSAGAAATALRRD